MVCKRPDTLIAKLKYVIGLALAFAMLLTYLPSGRTVSTDRVFFEVSPKLTTESTEVIFNVSNKSIYAINYEIGVDKLEKEENGEWVELELHPLINSYPVSAYAYFIFPRSCIFPTETVKYSYSCNLLFGQETAPKGNYRITFRYRVYGSNERSYYPYEFIVD